MSEELQVEATPIPEGKGFAPITTQEDFDKAFNRIFAEKIGKERDKYRDYDDLKAKASKLDELEESQKSEIEKLRERAEKAEKEKQALEAQHQITTWKQEISQKHGVDARVLHGSTEEEIEASAKLHLEIYPPQTAGVVKSESGKPASDELGTADMLERVRKAAKLK